VKASELHSLTDAELRARLEETREELMKLRFQFTQGQLSDYTRLKFVRRDVARIATILRQRERAAAQDKGRAS
jgi:large subunit ribosomal protein L29